MTRRRSRGLGYRRGGLTQVSREYIQAVLTTKTAARRNCPLFQRRVREAIETSMPSERFQPGF